MKKSQLITLIIIILVIAGGSFLWVTYCNNTDEATPLSEQIEAGAEKAAQSTQDAIDTVKDSIQ